MNKTSYRLVKFGEYKHDGLWRNTETFKTHAEAYEVYGKIFRELNSDPNLRGAAVIRTDDEKEFWYIEDSIGLGGLYLYKENDSFHVGRR